MAKILLIEDEPLTVKIYTTYLKAEGHQVASADNGEDGLRLASKLQPDLIVLDIMMPKLDGFSFLREIKDNEKTKKIPVLIYSNLSSDEDIKKAQKLGAAHFLVKSNLTPTQVINKFKEYLPHEN